MNLKKIFMAAVLCGTMAAGAFASDNHTFGIDICGGIVGYGTTKFDATYNGIKQEFTYKEVPFLPIKVSTYDCFLLNNHLGIYGSIGVIPSGQVDFKISPANEKDEDAWVGVGLEFMVGPAFGVDLGDSGIRFQCGVPFHAEFGAYFSDSKVLNVTTKRTRSYSAFGLGLTPQFRFMANRRCSFVLGVDFIFDFAMTFKQKNETDFNTTTIELDPKNAFRFKTVPYLGLGINFGK